jgi:hypothetical protein
MNPLHLYLINNILKQKTMTIDQAITHLENLGFTNIYDYGETVAFSGEYPDSEIEIGDIDEDDTAESIEYKARYISCCGAELDKDHMICPECMEHN